ncbi:hypothetical protein [Marinobacter changyiensis]|uniref:hypothetical protein n=1 Tax=Marinobacter changyiensis TaxID=2604091 RepID=UPI0012646560|nr:hypothetical protein [Marinobacter changyiensis]
MAKVDQKPQCQWDEQPSKDSTDQHRMAAIQKIPDMLRVLLDIANDVSGASGPRVAAARAVCEIGGVLGKPKEDIEALADMSLNEMSVDDLERFINRGRKTLNLMGNGR